MNFAYWRFGEHFENLASDAPDSNDQNLGPAHGFIAPVNEIIDSEVVHARRLYLHTPNIGYNETNYYGFSLIFIYNYTSLLRFGRHIKVALFLFYFFYLLCYLLFLDLKKACI